MMRHRRFSALLTAFPVALLLGVAAPATGQESVFLVLTRNQPRSIDPAIGADNPTRKVYAAVYEPLIDHKLGTADLANLEGVLAKSWRISSDGLVYTFNLRENVKFHDGSTLNADDVKVYLDRMKKIGLGRSWALDPVKEVRVVNPQTVELVLTRPYPPFILGLPVLYIVSAQAIKQHQKGDDLAQGWLAQNEAGDRPIPAEGVKVGEQIVMDKFDGYWRGWPPKHLSRVILRLVASLPPEDPDGGRPGALADTISPGDLESFRQRKDFSVAGDPTWGIQFAWMNTKKAPLDDVRVRRALRYAFPYDQMVRDVMRGSGRLAQGYLPPGFLTHDGSPPEKTDMSMARKLLSEAGVPNGTEMTVEFAHGFDFQRQAVELLAGTLRPLGINVRVQGVPFATMLQHVTDTTQRPHMFYASADPDTADPDSFLYRTFHSKSRHWSNFGFADPKLDDLLEKARYELKPERRTDLYKQVQAYLQETSPAICSFVQETNHVFRGNVKGYKFHPPYTYGAIGYYNLWLE